jgi:hypothetical protein
MLRVAAKSRKYETFGVDDPEPAFGAPAPTPRPAPATVPTYYLNVFTVEQYESNGKTGKRWTKIGAAFPHKEGRSFSIELKAVPIDGRCMLTSVLNNPTVSYRAVN